MAEAVCWIATVSGYKDNRIIRGENMREVLDEVANVCSDSTEVVTVRRMKILDTYCFTGPRHFLSWEYFNREDDKDGK